MEQELRFGLDLGRLALLKKWADYEQLMRPVFSCFHGQNKEIKNTVELHDMKLKNIFFFFKNLKKINCVSPPDFSMMTLVET